MPSLSGSPPLIAVRVPPLTAVRVPPLLRRRRCQGPAPPSSSLSGSTHRRPCRFPPLAIAASPPLSPLSPLAVDSVTHHHHCQGLPFHPHRLHHRHCPHFPPHPHPHQRSHPLHHPPSSFPPPLPPHPVTAASRWT